MKNNERMKIYLILTSGLLALTVNFGWAQQAEPVCQADNIPASTPLERFTVTGEEVLDSKTGLVWKRCVEGLQGDLCGTGEALELHWGQALAYLQENPQSGWRLPNIRELSTLVETQCANPAINTAVFPGTPSSHVWTSSPYHFYTHYSWYVDFAGGIPTYDERIRNKMLRLVKD